MSIKSIYKKTGFTLLEILLSISVIAIITGIGIPIYQSFQVRNDLDLAVNTVSQSLRRAQILSQAVEGDSAWGVYVGENKIVIFKGSGYAAREAGFDEEFDLAGTITPSGDQEIIFNKFTGWPTNASALVLTTVNETKTITINSKGLVSY